MARRDPEGTYLTVTVAMPLTDYRAGKSTKLLVTITDRVATLLESRAPREISVDAFDRGVYVSHHFKVKEEED